MSLWLPKVAKPRGCTLTPRKPTPAELRRRRHSSNLANSEHCARCGRAVISGYAEDGGFLNILDPYTLTPEQEMACYLLLGKYTIELSGYPGAWRISRLRSYPGEKWVITTGPASGPILPEHRCGTPPPSATALEFRAAKTARPDGPPPF